MCTFETPNTEQDTPLSTEAAIEKAERQFDDSFDEVAILRKNVTEKLYSTVMKLDLDAMATRDAEAFEAQMGAVNTLAKLLTDTEKSVTTRVTTKLKKKETETSAAAVLNVADILASLNNNIYTEKDSPAPSTEDRDALIEKRFSELELTPIIDSELLTDNNTSALSESISDLILNGTTEENA